MDTDEVNVCLKEISNNVLDCGKTVNIRSLSEDWGFSMKKSAEVLEKWLSENKSVICTSTFLLRGTAKDGSQFMTVVPEEKINDWTDKFEKCSKVLHSVRVKSESETFEIPRIMDAKKKRLVISNISRDICEESPDVIDSAAPSIDKKVPEAAEISKKKNLSNGATNSIASMFKNSTTEQKTPLKQEKVSPKKKTVKTTPTKTSNVNTSGKKGSIGSFFSKPNTNGKSIMEKEKVKVKTEESKINGSDKETQNTKPKNKEISGGKRSSITSEESDGEKTTLNTTTTNPPKRQKISKVKKPISKGSRIVQMVDSSEDEDEAPTEKLVEVSRTQDRDDKLKMEQPTETKSIRGKKRRFVTRTYEDEDGFIKTVKESEEYSSSEAEDVPVAKIEIKQKEKKPSPVKITKPKVATKQGSIMSFFAKK